MPLYEYICDDCKEVFEELTGMSETENGPVCPACGSEKTRRQFSTFAARIGAGSSRTSSVTGGCGGGGGFT